MAVVELKLHSCLIGDNRYVYSVTGGGNFSTCATPSDYMAHYGWGGLHSVVNSATRRLLTHKQRMHPRSRCSAGVKDRLWKYQMPPDDTQIRYNNIQSHDTPSPNACMPVVSCSGFLPGGVAQPCAPTNIPATAWSSRPQSPVNAKNQESTNCAIIRCLPYPAERNGHIKTWLPALRNRSFSRTSLAKDETPTRLRRFRLGNADRAASRQLPYSYQPGQLRIISDALTCTANGGVRGITCTRRAVCDLPFIETRQLLRATSREKEAYLADTFAIQLVEDCNTQTDCSTNDCADKSPGGSKPARKNVAGKLPGIVSRPFVVRSAQSNVRHFDAKLDSSRTKQLKTLMDRSMSTMP